MKQIARNTFIGTLALFLGACNQAEHLEGGEEVPIAFHTRVVSEGSQASGESARLLFWSDADFHDNLITGNAVDLNPRYTVLLDKEINYYTYENKISYQTPYTYPYNFEKIHATGYAPDYALTPADAQGGYTELAVNKEYQIGNTDLLTCDGRLSHSASMNLENIFLRKEKELLFRHLTAKLSFYGTRHPDMYGLVGVRNIRITIHNPVGDKQLVVPTRLKLYNYDDADDKQKDYSTYIASETTPYPDGSKFVHTPIIAAYDTPELGTCYVLSDGIEYGTRDGQFDPIKGEWKGTFLNPHPSLKITIEAELYNAEQGSGAESSVQAKWEKEVTDWRESYTGDMFLPGYEYKVTLQFDRLGIALRAEAVPWNSEELHEYPVHPITE